MQPIRREPPPRRILLFRALAEAGPCTTPELVDLVDPGIERPRQQILSWYGGLLRKSLASGAVELVGRDREQTGWQKCPPNIWAITRTGRVELAEYESRPTAAQRREGLGRLEQAKVSEAAIRRSEILRDAVERYPADSSRVVRAKAARELRELGLGLGAIGSIFGVSAEMIRRDLDGSLP